MSVTVIGTDYDNVDGLQTSLAAHAKAHRENGDMILNLAEAAKARAEGGIGPKKTDARPPYKYQAFPRHLYHADGRNKVVSSIEETKATKAQGFREEPYPVVRVAPADPAAEKAARVAQDAETAGKIASQNDLIQKLMDQVASLAKKD